LRAGVGVGHVVRGFGLDEACEDVLGVVELVLVQGMVLDAAGPEEDVGGFDVHAAAREDGDLRTVPVVEVMVGSLWERLVRKRCMHRMDYIYPKPIILKVGSACGLGNVHVGVRCHAFAVDSEDWAVGHLELGALGAAYACVDIPNSRTALSVQIILNDLGAWRCSLGLHDHIRPLDAATVSRFADLHDRYRVVFVCPGAAGSHDGREGLPHHTRAGWHVDCIGYFVNTCIGLARASHLRIQHTDHVRKRRPCFVTRPG
jgi:hypothetical protein